MPGYAPNVKRFILIICIVIIALIAVIMGRTFAGGPASDTQVLEATLIQDDPSAALSDAIRFKTISGESSVPEPFLAMQRWMERRWPRFHAVAKKERIAKLSILYTWPGTDTELAPVLFLAHQDVVPIEMGTERDWTHPPFAGTVAACGDEPGRCIWGRGAIDMKAALVGLMEGAERLARSGWTPKRTLMFAFGHDEEIGGHGAQAIAKTLKGRGIKLEWILDEGLLVTEGITPGISQPIAYIGIAEKGYVSLSLSADGTGGHSSMPPASTAVGRVARAIHRLEENPFPAHLDGVASSMFSELKAYMPFSLRMALSNLWLMESIVIGQLTKKPSTNAIVRTTQAATMFSGSPQENILPQKATAVVNFRIHPRDDCDSVESRVKKVIDDTGITVERIKHSGCSEPSSISSTQSNGYTLIKRTIRSVFPEAAVAPGLFIAVTDSRHYRALAKDVYLFHPVRLGPMDRPRIHGTNERIRVKNFMEAVTFYREVIHGAGVGG